MALCLFGDSEGGSVVWFGLRAWFGLALLLFCFVFKDGLCGPGRACFATFSITANTFTQAFLLLIEFIAFLLACYTQSLTVTFLHTTSGSGSFLLP